MVFNKKQAGFTIVELLVVIVVIGVLAGISISTYVGAQTKAQNTKIKHDLASLSRAIQLARINNSQTLMQVTGSGYSAGGCMSKPANTDLATLPRTDSCWTVYLSSLSRISNASGVNVNSIIDPWGRPYRIDENEGEGGGCGMDSIANYSQPFGGSAQNTIAIPLSGFTGCL